MPPPPKGEEPQDPAGPARCLLGGRGRSMFRPMRYLVTGGTGFIGRHLVRQLTQAGHDVVALVRDPRRAIELEDLGVELVRGDVVEPPPLAPVMDGADGVFHTAGWYRLGARGDGAAEAVNVRGTRNILEAAGQAAVPKIVYTSSIVVFGDTRGRVMVAGQDHPRPGGWLSEYERTKWLAHYEVAVPMMGRGLPLVIVQPGLVYGPGDHSNVGLVLRDYLRRRLPAIPAQGGCWAHVDDIAAGHVLAMERGRVGRSYVLAGDCLMWRDALRLARDLTGIRPPRLELPPLVARVAASLIRPLAAVLPLPRTYHPESLRIAAGVTYWADDAAARSELGWRPRPLEAGLAETLEAELRALA
jgi:dihydroflavonol-4-reductase